MRGKSYSNNSKTNLRDFRGGETKVMNKKFIAIITALALVVTLLAPVGVQEASAASDNTIDRTISVADDQNLGSLATIPTLRIKNKNSTFSSQETFRLLLPEKAKWNSNIEVTANVTGVVYQPQTNNAGGATITTDIISERILEVTLNSAADPTSEFTIPMNVDLSGVAAGEVQVTVDSRDSAVTGGSYTFATVGSGATVTTIEKVNTFSRSGNLSVIQIDETRVGSLGNASQTVTLKLPPKFQWDLSNFAPADVVFSGGLTGSPAATGITGDATRTLEFTIVPSARSTRGSLFLKDLRVRADRDASTGDIEVDVDGTKVSDATITVAKLADYGIEASVKEVKEVVAGRMDSDNSKTAKITIEETVQGSLIAGREIVVELPKWVKPISGSGINVTSATNGLATSDLKRDSNQNEFYFLVNNGIDDQSKSKYEFELILSVEANKTGDIDATFSGAGMEEQTVTIAKAVAPVTAEVAQTDLRIGVQNQKAPNIVITETGKGMLDEDDLTITLPKGIEFSKTPTVKVTDGNGEISESGVDTNVNVLIIPVTSSSTRAVTIEISDIELTLDRTVPEGAFEAKIGGKAIVKNNQANASSKTADFFDTSNVVKFNFANVVTPAPGETRSSSVFAIDSMNYTVVEAGVAVERTMDVAPYIKDSRTFLPVFFVAQALGVHENNIIWEPNTKTVTIIKGDRVAQMQIGSKELIVNGVAVQMDTAPEISNGRTMLPIFFIGQALGAQVSWDGETREVTVQQ